MVTSVVSAYFVKLIEDVNIVEEIVIELPEPTLVYL
jgi:hypothetical protein